jgi:hypothetical protein
VCGFVHTGNPVWLEEAYKEPINLVDTGLLSRNIAFANIVTPLLFFSYDPHAPYLDYAGGYGIFTRLMRDTGFDFYWFDPFTKNLLAKGFEYDGAIKNVEAVTSFETFEHFQDPLTEIEKMLAISKTIFFSTELLPAPIPHPGEWWYYGFEHGQHVSFYSARTLSFIAEKYRLRYYSFGPIHLFTQKDLPYRLLRLLLRYNNYGVSRYVKKKLKSKTMEDFSFLKGKR